MQQILINADAIKQEPVESRDEDLAEIAETIRREIENQNQAARHDRETSTAAPRAANRDPRLKNLECAASSVANRVNYGASTSGHPTNRAGSTIGKQRSFLDKTLTAPELIATQSPTSRDFQPAAIRDIRGYTGNLSAMMTSPRPGFSANIPQEPFFERGFEQQRSPLIASNPNALFLSQATTDNVHEAILSQRYRNIPQPTQRALTAVGADLDETSQRLQSGSRDARLSSVTFVANTRTLSTQTEPIALSQPEPPAKNFKNARTQTTNNTGVFSITIEDLSTLSREQREALKEFKKVCRLMLMVECD